MKKLLALLLALLMVVALAACTKKPAEQQQQGQQGGEPTEPGTTTPPDEPEKYWCDEFDTMTLGNYKYAEQNEAGEWEGDYVSLYDYCGKDAKIADVEEDPETGFGYITVDGEKHLLGLDFLTMAMVFNNDPTGSAYKDENEVYAAWWRLYITRWNYLLPEVPLYSNEYYDVYNTKIKGVEEHQTNPFWGVASALIDWTSDDGKIIIGSSTELSGKFRYSAFASTNPGSSDNDVNNLTTGLETVTTTKDGSYAWNDTVVASHEETLNEDGSKTFDITIKQGLKFSDGSDVTAKDYLAFTMAMYSPVGTQAGGRELKAMTTVGWAGDNGYGAYTGPDSEKGSKVWTGLRLLGDYEFSVTVPADYIPYFYDLSYAGFSAQPKAAFLGSADILDDGEGCYLTDDFYAQDADGYIQAAAIKKLCTDTSAENYAAYPWSGPYYVESYDTVDSSAVLKKNPYFVGNYEGVTPSIDQIVYRKIVEDTQLEDFKNGGIDILAAITGGKATDDALKAVEESGGKYAAVHYSRAGYGKLAFRCDYGPAQFTEVRQAVAYCMDRADFAKKFTGGYGGVVNGPYYTGSWMYQEAMKQGMELDPYATSADSAIEVLEKGGWIYNADGSEYDIEKGGVRYKMIPGDVINDNDKAYKSQDGTYTVTEVDGNYYMPLVINWFGTTPNEFTDLLQTGFKGNDNIAKIGMVVYNQLGDFGPMLDEFYQQQVYGYYSGTPMYCAFNFATGYNSAAYDYSWNMSVDPGYYDDYSAYYIKDSADILWLIEK